MAANIITFESEYMRECAKNVENAQKLVDEARASLKRANRHDGWRCPERQPINNSLNDLSTRLDRISKGLNETSSALTKGAGQFSDLETRAQKEENNMYNQLKNKWAFEAAKWNGSPTTLPMTSIPDHLRQVAKLLSNKIGDPVFRARLIIAYASLLIGTIAYGAGGFAIGTVKGVLSDIKGKVKTSIGLNDIVIEMIKARRNLPSDASQKEIDDALINAALKGGFSELYGRIPDINTYVKGAAGGVDGMYRGGPTAAKHALSFFESIFGKDPDGILNSDAFNVESLNDYLSRLFSMGNALPVYEDYIKDKLF